MVHVISLFFGLLATWLLLSGHYTPLLIGLGVVSSAVAVLIAWRMDVIDHEAVPLQLGLGITTYWAWLIWEIVKSSWTVTRLALSGEPAIQPTMVRVKLKQRTDVGRVIFANSITLTPGTLSVDLDDDEVLVHAITPALATDVTDGPMNAKVARLEGTG